MTVRAIVALPAAETLAAFHWQRAAAEARAYHEDMARRLAEDPAAITRAIEAAGVTVDNQADAIRRRDLERDLAREILILRRYPGVADDGTSAPISQITFANGNPLISRIQNSLAKLTRFASFYVCVGSQRVREWCRASPVPPRETLAIGAETASLRSAGVQGIPVSANSLAPAREGPPRLPQARRPEGLSAAI
jgi:hypothetical protein